jgi:very-short-patch-repair endonuclease
MTNPAQLTQYARDLRHNSTDAEKRIWSYLRNNQLGHKFRRQYPIDRYIVDFFCFEQNLIIELDGGQHNKEVDKKRTDFLVANGYRVLRFWNNDVLSNTSGVLQTIIEAIGPHPDLLPRGEGEKKV